MIKFGFKQKNSEFVYSCKFTNDDFLLKIVIKKPNIVETKLIEIDTKEIYTLHLTEAKGSYIGQIREEYNNILKKISDECFESDVFKTCQANKIIEYIKEKYDSDLEFLWEKSPDCAIARRNDNKKWFILFMTIPKNRLVLNNDELVEVINIRVPKNEMQNLLKINNIYPGYHMNKKHWISIILEDIKNISEIYERIDKSYELAKKK